MSTKFLVKKIRAGKFFWKKNWVGLTQGGGCMAPNPTQKIVGLNLCVVNIFGNYNYYSKCPGLIKKSLPVLGYRLKPSLSNKQFIKHSFI